MRFAKWAGIGLALVAVWAFFATRPARAPVRRSPQQDRPDVFIFLIDALRADHVGCYGYERPTTPNLDAFAENATLFLNAHTPSTWTRPAVASIFTGLAAPRHSVLTHHDSLSPSTHTLAEQLRSHGYHTQMIQTNGNASHHFAFDQGFTDYRYGKVGTAGWALEQVDLSSTKPIFLYLHIIEPHAPYAPSDEARALFDSGVVGSCDGSIEALTEAGNMWPDLCEEDFAHLLDLYDGETWDADRAFGQFLAKLKAARRYEDSLIIVVSDHGEAFGEHDTLQHGRTLNAEEMHIPLLVRFPGGRYAGKQTETPVSLLDIVPTIFIQVGLTPDAGLTGWDLGAVAKFRCPARAMYAHVCGDDPEVRELIGVIDADGYKRVVDVSRDHWIPQAAQGLWDTRRDPQEQYRIEDDARETEYATLASTWLSSQRAVSLQRCHVTLPPEARRELQALGYLQ